MEGLVDGRRQAVDWTRIRALSQRVGESKLDERAKMSGQDGVSANVTTLLIDIGRCCITRGRHQPLQPILSERPD